MFQKVGNRKVVSDDGFSIEFVGRHDLIYREQEKLLKFYIEDWKPKADILVDATGVLRDTGTPLEEVRRVVSNITSALKYLGLTVTVHGTQEYATGSGAATEYTVRLQKPATIEYSEGDHVYLVEGEKGWISTKIRVKSKSLNREWRTPHSDETISEEKLNSILERIRTALRDIVVFE